MKHKHYDAIVAWANGADIQARISEVTGWQNASPPRWRDDTEYRIKPKVIQYRRFLLNVGAGPKVGIFNQNAVMALEARENHPTFSKWIDTEWQEVTV